MTDTPPAADRRRKPRTRAILVVLALAGVAVGWIGRALLEPAPPEPATTAPASKPGSTLYVCSMNYTHHPYFSSTDPDTPCPYCGMRLIPAGAAAPDADAALTTTLSETARKLMQVETTAVERRVPVAVIRLPGVVETDETTLQWITAWTAGRLERMFVDFTGQTVRKGDPMVELYSPDLLGAQTELLAATGPNADLARERLRLWGLTDAQIDAIERRGEASDRVVIHAPAGGVVVEKAARPGAYVAAGTRLYGVADLSRVWVMLAAYESDLPHLRLGQTVRFTTLAAPGETLAGTISFIAPTVDEATRTTEVRVVVDNSDKRLKPGMFVRAVVTTPVDDGRDGRPPLVIPATAVLWTGTRSVVYVQIPNPAAPTYAWRIVELGPRVGDAYIIRHGLRAGERVVTRGAFAIDSERQLKAQPSMMASPADHAPHDEHTGDPH